MTKSEIITSFVQEGEFTVTYTPYLPQDLQLQLDIIYTVTDAEKFQTALTDLLEDEEIGNPIDITNYLQDLFIDDDQTEFDFDESNGIICDDIKA